MKRNQIILFTTIICACSVVLARADYREIIVKARAFVGSEAAIQALKSVHYMGSLDTVDDAEGDATPIKLGIDIVFQKPFQQRIIVKAPKNIETTALDDYEAWRRQEDPADPTHWRLSLLTADQVKRLRANAWENLSFFRGLEANGGVIEDRGDVEKAGIKCRKIAFLHEPSIVFIRYFNAATGQLVLTETEQGGTIREDGEIIVNGVRFPEKIVTASKGKDGKEQVVTITFEKIKVNEEFPSSVFRVPMMQSPDSGTPREPAKIAK